MHWADAFMGAGGFAAVSTAIVTLFKGRIGAIIKAVAAEVISVALRDLESKVAKRFDANDAATKKVAEDIAGLKVDFARETGGNSGGFRQAINELTKDVAYLKGQVAAKEAK